MRIGGFSKKYEVMSADSLQKSVGKAGASHRKHSSKKTERSQKQQDSDDFLNYMKKEEKGPKSPHGHDIFCHARAGQKPESDYFRTHAKYKKTVRAFFVAAYRSGKRAGDSRKATLWHTHLSA